MAKLQTTSDNINPFGGLFPIFKIFDKSGVRNEQGTGSVHLSGRKNVHRYGNEKESVSIFSVRTTSVHAVFSSEERFSLLCFRSENV